MYMLVCRPESGSVFYTPPKAAQKLAIMADIVCVCEAGLFLVSDTHGCRVSRRLVLAKNFAVKTARVGIDPLCIRDTLEIKRHYT